MRLHRLLLSLGVFLSMLAAGCSTAVRSEYEFACALQHRGKIKSARRLYADVLKRIPASDERWHSETLYRLGLCLWDSGETADAIADFEAAVNADNTNILARLRLGTILLAGGAPELASEQAMAVLQSSNGSTEALALLGAASVEAGQDIFAEAAYRQVLEREPGRVNIAIALADLLNRRDRTQDAREVLSDAAAASGSASPLLALGRLEEQEDQAAAAEQAYRQAAAREDTPEVNLRLAQFLERSSRVNEAQKVLEHVDSMRPQQPTALPDYELLAGRASSAAMHYANALLSGGKASHLFESASDQGQEKRAGLAARIVEAGLQAEREQDILPNATGVARIKLGQFRNQLDTATIAILQAELALAENNVTAAERAASTAVELASGSAGAHYMLGVVRYRAGDNTRARNAWLDAIQQNESFAPARLALAADAIRLGDASGAEQYILPVIREEPANLRALYLYARILLAQQRFGAAGVIANRALAVNGSQAEPHIILGQIAFAQGRHAECLLQFERALEKQHDSREALDGLIRVYRKGSVTRPMLQRMEQVAMTRPRSAVLLELAGRMYAERGWYKDARRSLQQALTIDPQRTTAAVSLARLLGQLGETEAAEEWAKRAGGRTSALLSGFTAQQRNDTGTAVAQYEAALREGENTGVAANNMAWLYAQQGKELNRALLLAEQARVLAPGNPAVLDTLGFVHLSRREYSQAIEVLKEAVARTTSEHAADRKLSIDIRRHLSEAYLRSGLPLEASTVSRGQTGERSRPQGTD